MLDTVVDMRGLEVRREVQEAAADELFARSSEVLAVGIIDVGEDGVDCVAADEINLAFDEAAVKLFVVPELLF